MAGAGGVALALAVSKAGALASLPCAMLNAEQVRNQVQAFREASNGPLNLNFFCHTPAAVDPDSQANWLQQLGQFYTELGVSEPTSVAAPGRAPFGEEMCEVVEALRPEVVSFHFGLPSAELLDRVKHSGALVLSSATTVAEAAWLEAKGCDAIIAQGYEAGGHRGMFLQEDIATQPGTMALVPQVVDAVTVPVIAAGGIADGRGITAAFALGAAGVQMGTVYLLTQESLVTDLHRAALLHATDDQTALTNLFSGRPARGLMNRVMQDIGPMSEHAPAFPSAGVALAPLKAAAEQLGKADFSSLWAGQAAALAREQSAQRLTEELAEQALRRCSGLAAAD